MNLDAATRGDRSIASDQLDAATFARVANLAQREAGLCIPESKLTMVQSRLSRRLKATGFQDFATYLDHVEGSDGLAEREEVICALTTNVSHFFREDHHFKALRENVLPDLLERARGGARARIWSAGCSTGQEPYTIAMMILELEPKAGDMDVKILASDIDRRVLSAARNGLYDSRQIESVPEHFRRKYFNARPQSDTAGTSVNDRVKALVSFRHLNLMESWPMRGTFDAVFCRNVMIYFSEETQAKLWPRFNAALVPGGWLFLGHSERIHDPLRLGFDTVGITTYRRRTENVQTRTN